MKMNRFLAVLLCAAMAMMSLTGFAFAEEATEEPFSQWNADAPALNALVEYVEAVTDPDSPDFIPEADRIATFDMDGTLMGELYPTYLEYYMLSFGNSSGDTSMHNYVIGNNPYRSAAFMLVADDDVRDYGNPEKGEGLKEKWAAAGYNVISMRDDWKTIYGEDVVKTGEFHWLEELAEDRVPVEAANEE